MAPQRARLLLLLAAGTIGATVAAPAPRNAPAARARRAAPIQWIMGGSGDPASCAGGDCGAENGNNNCDQVCASVGETCEQEAIDSLTSTAAIQTAFAAAGFTCSSGKSDMGCQTRYGGGHCAGWGSPYLYNAGNYLKEGRCFFGDGVKHKHASCGQKHADGNHRRLCPCTAPQQCTVTLADGWKFDGRYKITITGKGDYDLKALVARGFIDNTMSAAGVEGPCKLVTYTGDNFMGDVAVVTEGMHRSNELATRFGVKMDSVSSIRIIGLNDRVPDDYTLTKPGATACPAGTAPVTRKDECDRAASKLATQKQGRAIVSGSWGWVPAGCTLQTGNGGSIKGDWAAHFNAHASPAASDRNRYSMVCRVHDALSCDRGVEFINGASYSQSVLCGKGGCGKSWDAIEKECLAKNKGHGVFYQRHDPLGHVICGVYNKAPPATAASQRRFPIAAVCLPRAAAPQPATHTTTTTTATTAAPTTRSTTCKDLHYLCPMFQTFGMCTHNIGIKTTWCKQSCGTC